MKTNCAIITGINGYIGSSLARYFLNLGWKVGGVIRESSNLKTIEDFAGKIKLFVYTGDIDKFKTFLQEFDDTVVIHTASYFIAEHHSKQVSDLINSNILFGAHLLEAMNMSGCHKLINTGTSWQHYNNEDYNPACLYAATKEAFSAIVKFYVKAKCFNVVTLELFDTYGPGDLRNKIINLFIKNSKSHEKLSMSAGEQELDLIYIDDVIAAYARACDILSFDGEVDAKYSVTSKHPLRLKDIATLFESIWNCRLNIVWGAKPYKDREIMEVWNKGKELPGWTPEYRLIDGLRRLKELQ